MEPIRTEDVRQALTPYLGERFTARTNVCERAADLLRQYRPGGMLLPELTEQVRQAIFEELYDALGVAMMLELENGIRLRIMLSDVDILADEAVGVLLGKMTQRDISLPVLREHAMQHDSLAAKRHILRLYGRQLSAMERELLLRIIRENDPLHRE